MVTAVHAATLGTAAAVVAAVVAEAVDDAAVLVEVVSAAETVGVAPSILKSSRVSVTRCATS